MRNIYKFLGVLIFSILVFASCQEDPDVGGSKTQEMSGEWYVNLYNADMTQNLYGYVKITTSNTAADVATEFLINDREEIWDPALVVKVDCNVADRTFGSNKELISYSDNATKFVVSEGKIIAGYSNIPSKTVTDSIYFKVKEVASGDEYVLAGYRYTGWPEDDH